MSQRCFVVVGASLAGLRAAETLREQGFDGRIVLIGEEPHLPYDRPPLSKSILDGSQQPETLRFRDQQFYDDQNIELMLGYRAIKLRAAEGSVELDDGASIRADRVLLATGGRGRELPIATAHLRNVHQLRTLSDALSIRESLTPGASIVVIGAGFIGAEVAASARTCGCEVTMIELADLPLSRAVEHDMCVRIAQAHRTAGVSLRTGTGVTTIEGVDRVTAVIDSKGIRHDADAVVVGIGIVPNVELAADAGLIVDNGIVVDQLCTTSNPAVFAAGDVANFHSTTLNRRVRRENWQNATDQGASAALGMLGRGVPYRETPWFWSDQYDLKLHIAGHTEGADRVVWRGQLSSNSSCAFFLRNGMLIGAAGINRPKEVRAALQYVLDERAISASVLADESIDLRRAFRAATA